MGSTPDTAVPRLIVVDDTDPLIQYSPSSAFFLDSEGKLDGQGYGGPVFNRTLTGTSTNGSFTYNFNGTFVRTIVAAEGLYGWNCSVDDHIIASFNVDTPQVTNYIACDSAGLLEGSTSEHTLGYTISTRPLPSNPLDAVTLRIDGSDTSIIYNNVSGGWFESFGANATDNAATSVNFTFNGTSVSLFSVNTGNPFVKNASPAFYSLDGNSTSFDLPGSMQTVNSGGNFSNIFNWPLFTATGLPASQNNMEIAPSPNGTLDPQSLVIDYFIVRTNPSTKSGSASTRVSAIVGSVIGGVVGIAALLLALYFFCIRKRHFQYDSNSGTVPNFGAVTQ
ncbi:hypothetical protein C8J55DRAFT_558248 [Lentinula edodes]|uniref:Uncharacterized protein n=1 Tax=Lentinula lateritia TaxID=40482 RepID=A0A9W9DVR4_9AGAR|nr:hypothetical protein C8J55DRAFT_558248 [Lentinula edodes]